jgi:hypothetical protein
MNCNLLNRFLIFIAIQTHLLLEYKYLLIMNVINKILKKYSCSSSTKYCIKHNCIKKVLYYNYQNKL